MLLLLHWHLAVTKGIDIHIPSMNVDLKDKCNKILWVVCCFVPLFGYSVHIWYIKICIRASIIITQEKPDISITNVCHILFIHIFFSFLHVKYHHSTWFSCESAGPSYLIIQTVAVFTCYQYLSRRGLPIVHMLPTKEGRQLNM